MTKEETNCLNILGTLIADGASFAVYRLPGESCPRLVTQTGGGVNLLYDLEKLNGRRGFVIAPFRVSDTCPIVLIEPGPTDEPLPLTDVETGVQPAVPPMEGEELFTASPTETYAECFDSFINALRQQRFDKLVLSRSVTMDSPAGFSPSDVFRTACHRYLYSYIYMCYTPQTGIWLGSTPEMILSGEGDEWQTVALAGTQPLQEGRLPQEWSEKNRQEQAYVSSYIRNQLLSLHIHATESGPYPVFAGTLSHLRTDFRFSLTAPVRPGDLLKVLHPTPAVCGLPKEEAYRFIVQHEGYDRHYYSGFIGWLNPKGRTDLYVNLRCMHIDHKRLKLYAGSGLLSASELNDEWMETEKKLQTMRRLITRPFQS